MKNKELYTKDEIAFFESLEKDIDNGTYKPLESSKLDEKRSFLNKLQIIHLKK